MADNNSPITPRRWESQFTRMPEHTTGCTRIICVHPYHATREFFLTVDQWHDNLRPLLTPYWINQYTVTMIPCA